ncbi:MAG: hypothetical protein J3K34DRAFT_511519 [Monoraphidium minutum]|nr:MAG: hypothetical protein J3K34DRAFT_511519 [Monoraphidium minutum]
MQALARLLSPKRSSGANSLLTSPRGAAPATPADAAVDGAAGAPPQGGAAPPALPVAAAGGASQPALTSCGAAPLPASPGTLTAAGASRAGTPKGAAAPPRVKPLDLSELQRAPRGGSAAPSASGTPRGARYSCLSTPLAAAAAGRPGHGQDGGGPQVYTHAGMLGGSGGGSNGGSSGGAGLAWAPGGGTWQAASGAPSFVRLDSSGMRQQLQQPQAPWDQVLPQQQQLPPQQQSGSATPAAGASLGEGQRAPPPAGWAMAGLSAPTAAPGGRAPRQRQRQQVAAAAAEEAAVCASVDALEERLAAAKEAFGRAFDPSAAAPPAGARGTGAPQPVQGAPKQQAGGAQAPMPAAGVAPAEDDSAGWQDGARGAAPLSEPSSSALTAEDSELAARHASALPRPHAGASPGARARAGGPPPRQGTRAAAAAVARRSLDSWLPGWGAGSCSEGAAAAAEASWSDTTRGHGCSSSDEDGGEQVALAARQRAAELQRKNDALLRVLERERRRAGGADAQVAELKAAHKEAAAEHQVQLSSLRGDNASLRALVRRLQSGTGYEAVFEAYEEALRRAQAAAAGAEAANAALASELAAAEVDLAAALARQGGGGGDARRAGGGGDEGEAAQQVEDAEAVARAAEAASPGRGRLAAGDPSPGAPRRGGRAASPDVRGVRVLRANMRRVEGRAAALEEELAASQRRCLSLLRFQAAFAAASARLQRTDAEARAAAAAAAASEARAGEAERRAAAAEARAAALEGVKAGLEAARLRLARQLDEFGAQIAELRAVRSGRAGQHPQERGSGGGAAVAGPADGPGGARRLTGGDGKQSAHAGPPPLPEAELPLPPSSAGGVLGALMGEIRRGIQEAQRCEVQGDLLLDMAAGRAAAHTGRA